LLRTLHRRCAPGVVAEVLSGRCRSVGAARSGRVCELPRVDSADAPQSWDTSGAATVAAGLEAGATGKKLASGAIIGSIGAPGSHSQAIGKSHRPLSGGVDRREDRGLPDGQRVYASYTFREPE
jgi:hypothetical protein